HSYPEDTTFDEKDGWKRVFVSDLEYKYSNATITQQDRKKAKSKSGTPGLAGQGGVLKDALKSVGKFIPVVITWYTGKDLENPSCWPSGHWTPTDDAFVCALTLRGWWDRPKCFSFIELCYGPSRCIFVRVVDTCAGCQDGSHHVDLTRGAFSHLANLDKGVLGVNMRAATIPSGVW
ncbi:uncharacterized protein EI90DRAFT_2905840, partial [Cantharellus anzutake]|uniref:uncharacterized protein n=1 Tax=Cantharellus anzutake TaxID=1750568 RepID=UPI0019047BD7